jgi:hypothetical protein
MPKTSGAVLDWVPQKAAQQMQSEAMTRFMPIPSRLSRGDAAQRARQVVPAPHLRSIGAMQSSSRGLRSLDVRGQRAAVARRR